MNDKLTQIPVKKSTRQRLRNISIKGETYDNLINKLITTREKFENEEEFRRWFEDNFELFGFDEIKEGRTGTAPDYTMVKNGEEIKVGLETLSSNFSSRSYDPNRVDLVICLIEDEKLPVKTLEITSFEFEGEKIAESPEDVKFLGLPLMLELARIGADEKFCEVTSEGLAERINRSPQTISQRLDQLAEANFIDRELGPGGRATRLTSKGANFLRSIWMNFEEIYGTPVEALELSGRITTGMGEGSYYVGKEKYREQFKEKLGFDPYPGTLDIKLDVKSLMVKKRLERSEGIKIEGFSTEERSFGDVKCFPAKIGEEAAAVVIPSRTYHEEDVIEVVSPVKIRHKYDLEDGDEVSVEVKT